MRWAGFLPQMLMRSTKLSATSKLSAEHQTPPIANTLLLKVLNRMSYFALKYIIINKLKNKKEQNNAEKRNEKLGLLYQMLYLCIRLHRFEIADL